MISMSVERLEQKLRDAEQLVERYRKALADIASGSGNAGECARLALIGSAR